MIIFDETFPAALVALADARKKIRRALDDLRFGEDMREAVELIVAEAGANAIVHGKKTASRLHLTVVAGSRGIEVVVADDGTPFPKFNVTFDAIRGMPDIFSEGGRGLALLKQACDRASYASSDGWNRLTLFRRYVRTRLRILVAEDSDATLAFFEAVLGQKFDIRTARSVEELKAQLTPDIDLLISDLHLGDGKASDFLAELEKTRDGLKVPVILVTSDTSGQVVKDAVRLGTETVLAKPVSPKALFEAVDKTLAARARQRMNEARSFNALLEGIVGRPDFSDTPGFNVAWRMGTAGSGGGDLLTDLGGIGRRRIALADLMGHGVSARARSATWAGLLRGVQTGLESARPNAFIDRFSAALCRGDLPDHVTGTLIVIDLVDDGSIEIASAGHPAPVIMSDGKFRHLELEGSLPGLTETVSGPPLVLHLQASERLIAATDGIDPDSLAYRLDMPERLRLSALDGALLPVEAMASAMADAVDSLTGYRPDDDWTLLIIETSPRQPARA